MPDLSTCPCSGNTLDRLVRPAILTVLSRGPLHGYRVAEEINEALSPGDQKPDMSGVYRSLKVMEEKGLVASLWDVSNGGPARRRYAITPDGKLCLAKWIDTLEQYRHRIEALIRSARKTLVGPCD